MDICRGKLKYAAPPGWVLNTTGILNDKNYQAGHGRMPEFTGIINKRAVTIDLSKKVNIKFHCWLIRVPSCVS